MWKEEAVFRLIRLGLSRADIERVFDECGVIAVGPTLVAHVKSAETEEQIDKALDRVTDEVWAQLRQV
jgi:hypothetical protein